MSERTTEAVFYGGRPNLPPDEPWVAQIILVQNDRLEWIWPPEIRTREYPTNRVTGRYILREGVRSRPEYDWEPQEPR